MKKTHTLLLALFPVPRADFPSRWRRTLMSRPADAALIDAALDAGRLSAAKRA